MELTGGTGPLSGCSGPWTGSAAERSVWIDCDRCWVYSWNDTTIRVEEAGRYMTNGRSFSEGQILVVNKRSQSGRNVIRCIGSIIQPGSIKHMLCVKVEVTRAKANPSFLTLLLEVRVLLEVRCCWASGCFCPESRLLATLDKV